MWPFKKISKITISVTDEQSSLKIKLDKSISAERVAEVLFLLNSGQLKEISISALDDFANKKNKYKEIVEQVKNIYKSIDNNIGMYVADKNRLNYLIANKRNPVVSPSQAIKDN